MFSCQRYTFNRQCYFLKSVFELKYSFNKIITVFCFFFSPLITEVILPHSTHNETFLSWEELIEYPKLERTHKDYWAQPVAPRRTTQKSQICPDAPWTLPWPLSWAAAQQWFMKLSCLPHCTVVIICVNRVWSNTWMLCCTLTVPFYTFFEQASVFLMPDLLSAGKRSLQFWTWQTKFWFPIPVV